MTEPDTDTEDSTDETTTATDGWFYKGWGSPLYPLPTY